MTFLEPTRFFWLLILPALAVAAVIAGLRHRRNLHRFATPERLGATLPTRSRARGVVRTLLLLACLGLTLVALADPRRGERERAIPPGDGVSVVFALDVSRSMLAQDVSPTRLDRAKQYVRELTRVLSEQEEDASVGLVAFAGAVKRVTPLTRNVNELELALQATDTTSAGVGGSNLADAVQVAARSFVERRGGHKVVVMLTDGEENLSGEPATAAKAAFDGRGVRFFPVGLGSPDTGASIPLGNGQVMAHEGAAVKTTLDAAALIDVANNGGGVYIPAETKRADMAQVYRRVIRPRLRSAGQDDAQGLSRSGTTVKAMIPRFGWWAWPALGLLLIERLIAGWPARRRGAAVAAALLLAAVGLPAAAQDAPADALTAYNAAVAAHQAGDHAQAQAGFHQAAQRGVGQVEARARYNVARAAHAQAIAALPTPGEPQGAAADAPASRDTAPDPAAGLASDPAGEPDDPIALLDVAVREYAAALGADPTFDHARANLEAAARLRAQLRQQQDEQEQQEPQQEEQQENQEDGEQEDGEPQDQQQDQDQEQSPQDADDSQDADQDPGESSESGEPQDSDDAEPQEGDPADPDDADQDPADTTAGSEAPEASTESPDESDEAQSDTQGEPQNEPATAATGEPTDGEPQALSPDEAMKLLQRIRDQDLQRRIAQYRRDAQRQQAVEKDW